MNNMNNTKKVVFSGLLVAMGIALPIMFHSIPNAGSIFLPMHIPVLLSGFIGIMALSRTGIRLFWSFSDIQVPRLRLNEALPVALLITLCGVLAMRAGPITNYLEQTAAYLDEPHRYVSAVLARDSIRSVGIRP